jgi:hypothetical protein
VLRLPLVVSIAVVISVTWLVITASACTEAPDLIVLGPLPKRPVDPNQDDAGVEIPDGSIACRADADCDDGVECTRDVCLSQGYCRSTTDYTRCSDGVFCNGIEVCDAFMGCLEGVVPTCDDMEPCTIDHCDEEQKQCVHAPRDFDHDGEADVHCPSGTDCDDFDPARGAQRPEICGDIIDNDCDDVIDELGCTQPEHDTCMDALDVSAGGTFEVSLLGAIADYSTTCAKMAGAPDAVFTFELKAPSDVKLAARGIHSDGMEETATLALQTRCGMLSSEVQCETSFPVDLRVRALPAGRYYVIGSSVQAASFLLSVQISPATPAPTNTTCENAIDVSKGGRFEGDFVDVGDDAMTVCGTMNQPDVFYTFTLDRERDVEISAVSDESGMLTIGVRDSCDPASTVRGCRSAEPVLTRLHQLPAGQYVIVLEGPSSREVSYALDVAILDPTPIPVGDNCLQPTPLPIGTPVLVSLSDKQAEVETSCETSGPDAVFSLHLDQARDVMIQADAEDVLAVAALQSRCGDITSERGCRKGAPLSARVLNVPAGDYFVVVDSPTAQSVSVQVQTTEPTPTIAVTGNDTCATAYEISGIGGIFTGDTSTLINDYTAACDKDASSRDAVFKLVLPDHKHVVARLDSGFDGVLHRIRDQRTTSDVCMNVKSEMCMQETVGGIGAELDESLLAGTYYYIVDGYQNFNFGYYQFEISITAP